MTCHEELYRLTLTLTLPRYDTADYSRDHHGCYLRERELERKHRNGLRSVDRDGYGDQRDGE